MKFEEGNIWKKQAESREVLYDKVEKKVQSILELRRFVDSNAIFDIKALDADLENLVGRIKNDIGSEKIDKYAAFLEKRKRLKEIACLEDEIRDQIYVHSDDDEEYDDEGDSESDSETNVYDLVYVPNKGLEEELEKLDAESIELSAEIDAIEEDDDVVFFSSLDGLKHMLIRKRDQVLSYKEKIEGDQSFVSDTILKEVELEGEAEVQISTFSVNIILSPEDYRKIRGDSSNGTHYRNSVINLIKDRPGKDATIRHEENHNISESFVSEPMYIDGLIRKLQDGASRLDRLNDMGVPDILICHEKDVIKSYISNYYRNNFSEIIADIDRLPSGDMVTFLHNYEDAERKLSSFSAGLRDKDFRSEIDNKIEEMENKFIRYFFDLSNIFYFANKIVKTEEAKALIVLFGNGKGVRKVERHLKHYDSRFDDFTLLRRFTGEMDYMKGLRKSDLLSVIFGKNYAVMAGDKSYNASLEFGVKLGDFDDIKRIRDLVLSGFVDVEGGKLMEGRLREMEEEFFNLDNFDFLNNSIDAYRDTIGCLKEICDHYELDQERVEHMKYGLFSCYIESKFAANDFEELEKRFVGDFENYFGANIMKNCITEEIKYRYLTKNNKIRKKQLREFVYKIGMSEGDFQL